jgi:hypothetical protein
MEEGTRYLDSVINLSYVLLRMLEKYSKSKAYMYVRKKRSRAGKKRKNKSKGESHPASFSTWTDVLYDVEEEGEGLGQGDDEEEEMDSGALTYGEHAFEFEKFEAVRPSPPLSRFLADGVENVELRIRGSVTDVHDLPRGLQDVHGSRADEEDCQSHASSSYQSQERRSILQGASPASSVPYFVLMSR